MPAASLAELAELTEMQVLQSQSTRGLQKLTPALNYLGSSMRRPGMGVASLQIMDDAKVRALEDQTRSFAVAAKLHTVHEEADEAAHWLSVLKDCETKPDVSHRSPGYWTRRYV